MSKTPLIMDCDPGLDDAIAILLALASPEELDVLGITTVAGNGPAIQTQENARRICQLAGREDMTVTQGCPRSVYLTEARNIKDDTEYVGADIHGDTGLGGLYMDKPTMPLSPQHSVNFIIETIKNSNQKVTLAPTGVMTNVACALIMAPEIADNIEKIVLMGGVMNMGNITPAAEFNFYTDPHAAHVVFTSSIPIVMMGLDVTRQVQTTESWLDSIKDLGTPVAKAVVEMLSYYHRPDAYLEPGVSGGVLHDPNVIAYILKPELYSGRNVFVEISTTDDITAGRTTVDWWSRRGIEPNAYVIDQVDTRGFFDLLTERLKRYPKEGG